MSRIIESGEMARWVKAACPRIRDDDPCPYCKSSDCAGHTPEDARSSYAGKLGRRVDECHKNDGDDPCDYCGDTDCAGHPCEDAESTGFENGPMGGR